MIQRVSKCCLAGLVSLLAFQVQAAESATSGVPDLTGVWMPTAIVPDGNRTQVYPDVMPYLPEVVEGLATFEANYNPVVDDGTRSCLPYGMPRQMAVRAQYPTEIIQQDDRITLIVELHNDVRRIYLDGREFPQDMQPAWMGYSIGSWEGQELHVETRSMRTGGYPNPQSRRLVVQERVKVVDSESAGPMLEWEMTLTDPEIYTEPVVIRNYFRQYPDLQIGEYFCSEDLWRQNLDGRSGNIPWR